MTAITAVLLFMEPRMSKGGGKGHTPREAKDDLKSTQQLSVIDALSEGPIVGPVNGLQSVLINNTPVVDADGNSNIHGVTVVYQVGRHHRHRWKVLRLPARKRCWVWK